MYSTVYISECGAVNCQNTQGWLYSAMWYLYDCYLLLFCCISEVILGRHLCDSFNHNFGWSRFGSRVDCIYTVSSSLSYHNPQYVGTPSHYDVCVCVCVSMMITTVILPGAFKPLNLTSTLCGLASRGTKSTLKTPFLIIETWLGMVPPSTMISSWPSPAMLTSTGSQNR